MIFAELTDRGDEHVAVAVVFVAMFAFFGFVAWALSRDV